MAEKEDRDQMPSVDQVPMTLATPKCLTGNSDRVGIVTGEAMTLKGSRYYSSWGGALGTGHGP